MNLISPAAPKDATVSAASTNQPQTKGRLFLVPAPLDFACDTQSALQDVMPLGTLKAASSLAYWICENAKTARAYLKRVHDVTPLVRSIQEQHLQELPREVHKKGDFSGASGAVFDARHLLEPALKGHDMGLMSEAGMPAIADPGASVVRAAHQLHIPVMPLVGPSSLLLALAASGLSGQQFAFVGYLPQDGPERTQKIKALEHTALQTGQTQLFIETPYRNTALLTALLQTLQGQTLLSVSAGLTLSNAWQRSATVKEWKTQTVELDKHTPVVFAIGR